MSELEHLLADLAIEGPGWVGLAVGGWFAALLAAVLAVWQAARADGTGVRAAEAAHELRGPLCAARLALSGLQRAFPDALAVAHGVAAIDLELGRAGLALDDLASVGAGRDGRHLGASRRTRELVDVAELARAAEPAWHALAEARATTLDLRTPGRPVEVLGDPRRVLQGIENLIANACEHGRGPVSVTIVDCRRGLRIEVADGGRGPSPRALRRARRRASGRILARAGRSARGHGLAVAARLAHDTGGRLRARSCSTGVVVSLELSPAGVR